MLRGKKVYKLGGWTMEPYYHNLFAIMILGKILNLSLLHSVSSL